MKPDLLIDVKWINQISYSLTNFRKISRTRETYNCRCPVCGDSEKSSKKSRFYFYTKNNQMNVDCKNCGYHGSFFRFMKDQFPNEFESYKKDQMLERFGSNSKRFYKQPSTKPKEEPKKASKSFLEGVVPILDLPQDHEAVTYLKSRKFGIHEMSRLMYSEDFKLTANSLSYEPLSDRFPKEPRIVIPFYNNEGKVTVIQGRSLDPKSNMRYISIKSEPEIDKVYGKYELNDSDTTYCVEGPFDSLFVDNCLATCDSNLTRVDVDVYIFDNQPRNKEIIELMSNAIAKGKNLVVWPVSPDSKIDINDMIKMGMTRKELMEIINKNTYSGLKAKLKFNEWKRL